MIKERNSRENVSVLMDIKKYIKRGIEKRKKIKYKERALYSKYILKIVHLYNI